MTCVGMTAPTNPQVDPPVDRYAAERRRLKAMSKPFLNDEFMEGPLRFRGSEYRQPRLRRSTFDPKTLVFESRLGGGDDGFVWKVRFDSNEGPFAMKVFWDQVPPQEVGSYYPMQRECQNAAVLQMMEAAVASDPVLVYTNPYGKVDANENYFSFCEENAISKLGVKVDDTLPSGTKLISEMPPMVQCYGWVKFNSDVLEGLPISLQATHDEPHKVSKLVGSHMDCIAIVYEFIEESKNRIGPVGKVDNFLWLAGFAYANEPEEKSWRNSMLVDHSEIIHMRGYGWDEEDYMGRSAEQIIDDEDLVEELSPDYDLS